MPKFTEEKKETLSTVKPTRRSFLPIYTQANEVFEYPSGEKGMDWLTNLMDRARQGEQIPWNHPRKTIRSSGAGDQCVRSLSLTFLGWQDIFSARTLRIFETGRSIESSIIKEFQDAHILLGENVEVKFNLPIPLAGIYDVMLEHPETLERIVGELKSINEGYFDKLPEPSSDPKINFDNLITAGQVGYVSQLTVYFQATEVHKGFLLYEAKNTQKRKIYELIFNESFFNEIIKRLTEAWNYAKKNEIAPRVLNPGKDIICRQCKKSDLCVLLAAKGATREDAIKLDQKIRGVK